MLVSKPCPWREGRKVGPDRSIVEVVGGGFFVFRRGSKGNRIKPAMMPFEHASREEAIAEAERLARKFPGNKYQVFGRASDLVMEVEDAASV